MKYIDFKEETIQATRVTCSHPLISRIWQYGGLCENPTNGEAYIVTSILLNDGGRHEFRSIEDAEIFLSTLKTD